MKRITLLMESITERFLSIYYTPGNKWILNGTPNTHTVPIKKQNIDSYIIVRFVYRQVRVVVMTT